MGKNTLEQIVPMTEDPAFRAELLRERNLYRELNQEAHTAIDRKSTRLNSSHRT